VPRASANICSYLTADYDSEKFTIGPALTVASQTSSDLKSIHPHNVETFAPGALAGIVVGCFLAVVGAAGLLYWFWWRPRRARRAIAGVPEQTDYSKAELDSSERAKERRELDDTRRAELAGREPGEVEAQEKHELYAGEAGHELLAADGRPRHQSQPLLGHTASGKRIDRASVSEME